MPAQAACWGTREAGAAQVRAMQTSLMVAALRCHAAGIDIGAAYDGFVGAQHVALAADDLAIKQHFAASGGAQADYDRFTTALANDHGDDETTQATCAEAAALAQDGAKAAAEAALRDIAIARVFPAALPGGACDTAAAAPAIRAEDKGLPPIVLAAAPHDGPAPVTHSPDVVAALTVLARYQTAAATAPAVPTTQVAVIGPR